MSYAIKIPGLFTFATRGCSEEKDCAYCDLVELVVMV